MKISPQRSVVTAVWFVSILSPACATAADPAKLTNAAQVRFGARANILVAKNSSLDPSTPPEAVLDNNAHTRCVVRGGVPYTVVLELPLPVSVEKIAFAHSDYASERAPKDIEISLDDNAPLRQTLELRRPQKGKLPDWQEVAAGGKKARVVRITVLSNYEPSATVNWGGFGEIAVLTSDDVATRFAVPAEAAAVSPFVHQPALASVASVSPAKVRLPPVAKPGEHPRLLLTAAEVADLKTALSSTERGRAAKKAFDGVASSTLKAPIDFPDPKGPLGQLKDRGDDIAKRHDRLALNAGTLGMAYTLTGNREYATRAAEILRGYAERYQSYPEHKGVNKSDTGKVMGQRLSEAMWLIPLIQAYDHIYESGALTPDDRKSIENQLIRPAVTFIRRVEPANEIAARDRANANWRTDAPPKGGAANWLLFYNAATMMAGAVMDDANLKDLAAADFKRLLANGIGTDGMWDEGAIGYQFFAMSALIGGVETAARQGIDLWSFDNNRFKKLFDSPLRYAYPDGSAPGINDSSRTRFGDWSTMSYDYAFLRYGDPAYSYLVNASPRQLHTSTAVYFPTRIYDVLPEPKAITFPSTVFENLGYSILRAPQVYALMDYGPHGGVHGHLDKLNLILFATGADGKGDEMGGEPRMHRYEDPLHGEWTKHTVAHNTLTVDETSQTASEGRLLVFEDAPAVKLRVMRAETTASVPGALLDRTVVVTPDAVVDMYHGQSAYKRTWDRTFRFQGELRAPGSTTAAAKSAPLGTRDGYQHIAVTSRQSAAELWQGAWQTTVGAFAVTVAGAPGQEMIVGKGPDNDSLALARQQGMQANFAAAYSLPATQNPVVSLRQSQEVSAPAVMEMTQRDGTQTMVIVAHGAPGIWQSGGWKSDARVLVLRRRKGEPLRLLLTGGTFAEGKEGVVRATTPGNYSAQQSASDRSWKIISRWTPEAKP